MVDEIPRHRYETCGFLALRNRITGLFDETPQEYRWRTEIPKFRNPSVRGVQPMATSFYDYPYSGVPTCLVRAHPLHNEFASQDQAKKEEIFATLERERDCAERGLFTPWQQGFTPKEHREMIDRQWMIEREDRRDKEQREWQERQEARVEQRHKEAMAAQEGIHKHELLILGGLVTLAIVIATILGSAIQAGWFSKWFGLGD